MRTARIASMPWWSSPAEDASTVPRLGEIAIILFLLTARTIRIWGLDLDPTRG